MEALPSSRDREHWLSAAAHSQDVAIAAFTSGMRQLLDIAEIWTRGRKMATTSLYEMDATLPATCPFELGESLSSDFDIDAALG